jgi:hypothetical protein
MLIGNSPLTGEVISPLTRNITPNATNGATVGLGSWIISAGANTYSMSLVLAGACKVSFFLYVQSGTLLNTTVELYGTLGGLGVIIDRYTWIGGESTTNQLYNVTGTAVTLNLTTQAAQLGGPSVQASLHVMSM